MLPDRRYALAPARPEIVPDSVDAPEVRFGEGGARLDYLRRDGGWARVVFDRFDSLRICRGEYPPYSASDDSAYEAISIVRPSTWLRERYEYEHAHYAESYGLVVGNSIEEMLLEFEHYLFCFHDEFVEVIAGGVHIDLNDRRHEAGELRQRPGWTDLPAEATEHRWTSSGIACGIRIDPRPRADVIEASRLGDQAVVQLALELDGRASVSHRLAVRTRDGETKSRWRGYFGAVERTFAGIPSLEELRPLVEEHAAEVRAGRNAMGKV